MITKYLNDRKGENVYGNDIKAKGKEIYEPTGMI